MQNRTVVLVLLAFVLGFTLPVCSCVGTGLMVLNIVGDMVDGSAISASVRGDAIAVIELNGTIDSSSSQLAVSSTMITPDQVSELLRQAAAMDNVKAVVVKVNSPGGSAIASDEIYHLFLDFEKPVVIWMGEMAASGGYYISCGGDYIFAHRGTLTGSIGVISMFTNAEQLLEKIGVEVSVITSGAHKDMGSFSRDMTEEERYIWSTIIDQIYDDFVQVIATSRGLSEDTVRQLADGRIYTGQQALELELVDEVGLFTDAVTKAAELGGIEGEPEVIDLKSIPTLLETLYGLQGRSAIPTLQELLIWVDVPSVDYRFANP